jgi:alpha-methylacyl-CoA racemase
MRPLDALRVLDFSRLGPGPYASMLLADMGASVIRVDRLPLAADLPAFLGDVLGRGKRSIGVDLKHPSGVAVALALAERSAVRA